MNFPKMRTATRTGNSGVPNAVEHIWYGYFCRQYTVGLHLLVASPQTSLRARSNMC